MLVTFRGNKYLVYDEKTSDHACVFRVGSTAVPVTSILAPVMYRESSEARKAQTSATSGGRQQDSKKKVWGSAGNWARQTHTVQSTSFSLDLLKRIKTDGRQHRSKVWRSNEVTCPSVLCARGGSFLFCINVLNVHPRWPAGSPILPRGTRDVIWKTRQIETMEGQSCLSTFICCRLY